MENITAEDIEDLVNEIFDDFVEVAKSCYCKDDKEKILQYVSLNRRIALGIGEGESN